jgi:hypothetical protein
MTANLLSLSCSVMKDNYEVVVHGLFRQASVLDHSKDPCSKKFIPDTKVQPESRH